MSLQQIKRITFKEAKKGKHEMKNVPNVNVKIFKRQGASEKQDKKSIKVIILGNPANTNCLSDSKLTPSMPKET